MPKLNKSFHLEITVEQFLNACSLTELGEIEMLLDTHIRRAEEKARRKAYREANIKEEFKGGFQKRLPGVEYEDQLHDS